MSEIEVIKYLLSEIETEQEHAERYEKAKKKAEEKAAEEAKRTGEKYVYYRKFMPDGLYDRRNKTLIRENAKKIRQLMLKFY